MRSVPLVVVPPVEAAAVAPLSNAPTVAAVVVAAIPQAPAASSAAWSAASSADNTCFTGKQKPGITPGFLFWRARFRQAAVARLFARGFPQGRVDAVLPAGSALLKMLQDIL